MTDHQQPEAPPVPDTDHKAMGLAYGWLWHATTYNLTGKTAR